MQEQLVTSAWEETTEQPVADHSPPASGLAWQERDRRPRHGGGTKAGSRPPCAPQSPREAPQTGRVLLGPEADPSPATAWPRDRRPLPPAQGWEPVPHFQGRVPQDPPPSKAPEPRTCCAAAARPWQRPAQAGQGCRPGKSMVGLGRFTALLPGRNSPSGSSLSGPGGLTQGRPWERSCAGRQPGQREPPPLGGARAAGQTLSGGGGEAFWSQRTSWNGERGKGVPGPESPPMNVPVAHRSVPSATPASGGRTPYLLWKSQKAQMGSTRWSGRACLGGGENQQEAAGSSRAELHKAYTGHVLLAGDPGTGTGALQHPTATGRASAPWWGQVTSQVPGPPISWCCSASRSHSPPAPPAGLPFLFWALPGQLPPPGISVRRPLGLQHRMTLWRAQPPAKAVPTCAPPEAGDAGGGSAQLC